MYPARPVNKKARKYQEEIMKLLLKTDTGMSFNQLLKALHKDEYKALNRARGSLISHLRTLERHKRVSFEKQDDRVVYCAA